MAMMGFNQDQIKNMVSNINESANEMTQTITEKIQKQIIDPMSEVWYTQNGVKYWSGFAEAVNELSGDIAKALNNLIDAIGNIESRWAEATGTSSLGIKGEISGLSLKLALDKIQPINGNGEVGIDTDQVNGIVAKFDAVQQDILDSLKQIASKLDADSSFLGMAQGAAVNGAFVAVSAAIGGMFSTLSTTIGPAIKDAMNEQETIAKKNAEALNQ